MPEERIHPDESAPERLGAPSIDAQIEDVAAPSPEDERVQALIQHTIDVPVLAEAVARQEAADAADILEDLEDEEAADVLELMEDQRAAEALAEMEGPLAAGMVMDLVDEGKADYAARLLELMASDDAADLLQELADEDDDAAEAIFRVLPQIEERELRELAGYDEDSAAGLMTTDYLAVRELWTVGQATEAIRATELPEDINHLPVVDEQEHLIGVVGLRSLLLHHDDRVIKELMDRSPKAVRADLDQEEVAREFDRYDMFMLPVIDADDRLIGIVTVDDVIDIIREEQTEDVQKTVGAGAEEAVYSQISEKFRGRFPWLATSLVLTCAAAVVIFFFEELISEQPILAFFMPVIAALVGNAGHQALAVTLRGIVLDEVRRDRVAPLVVREGVLGLINGAVLGGLMFLLVWGLSFAVESVTWRIGLVAAVALAVSMCAGTLAGSGIPLIMRRLGADPAQSSAIFLIMLTDAIAFATFLGLAYVLA
jgi:magnesium transporter